MRAPWPGGTSASSASASAAHSTTASECGTQLSHGASPPRGRRTASGRRVAVRSPAAERLREGAVDRAEPAEPDRRTDRVRDRARGDAPDDPAVDLERRAALRLAVEPEPDQLALQREARPCARAPACRRTRACPSPPPTRARASSDGRRAACPAPGRSAPSRGGARRGRRARAGGCPRCRPASSSASHSSTLRPRGWCSSKESSPDEPDGDRAAGHAGDGDLGVPRVGDRARVTGRRRTARQAGRARAGRRR